MTISDYSYRYTQNEAACCFLYYFFMFINFLFCCVRLGRVLVMVLDRRPTSRGFDCPPPLYRVHPPPRWTRCSHTYASVNKPNRYQPMGGDARGNWEVTGGLVESNGSLPPSL